MVTLVCNFYPVLNTVTVKFISLIFGFFFYDGLLNYSIDDDDTLESHTFITQEMLKKGYLATNAFYACVEHKEREVEEYFRMLGDVVSRLADIRKKGECVRMHLEFEPRQRGFKRLNS